MSNLYDRQYEVGHIRTDRGLFIDKGNQVFDVRHPDFGNGGAKGNGSVDDTQAFQDAIDAASDAGGGIITSAPGARFLVTDSLTVPSGVSFDLRNATIVASGNQRPIVVQGTEGSPVTNVHIRNIRIECVNGSSSQSAVRFEYAEDCSWGGLYIDSPGLDGIEVFYSKRVHGFGARIYEPEFIGILYFDSEHCTDRNVYVYRPTWWGHQFKSCLHCVSYDIEVEEPQEEYGLYMWSGFDGVSPGPRANEHCGYVRPYVLGAATSKHLLYISASRYCFAERPVLVQVSGGWTPLAVGGVSDVDDGAGGTETVQCDGTHIDSPQITCAGTTQALSIAGTVTNPLKNVSITGRGRIVGGGDRPLLMQYVDADVEGLTLDTPASDAVEISNATVRFRRVRAHGNTAEPAFVVKTSSRAEFDACEADGMFTGLSVDSTSSAAWRGGRLKDCVSVAAILQGEGSYIGGGALITGSRKSAGSLQAQVRITGTGNTIEGAIFDTDGSTFIDAHVKEETGASNNRIGQNTYIDTPPSGNIVLLAGSGSSRAPTKILTATAPWNPASINDGASEATTVTVTGAAAGDIVRASLTTLIDEDWDIEARVTAADTVTVRITNRTGGAVDLGSGTLRVVVEKYT